MKHGHEMIVGGARKGNQPRSERVVRDNILKGKGGDRTVKDS